MAKLVKLNTIWDKQVRWICLLAILLCILLYFKINFAFDNDSDGDHFMEGYFVDTLGCQMLALNPFSKKAMYYLAKQKPMKCTKVEMLQVLSVRGENYLVLSKSTAQILKMSQVERLDDIYCKYWIVEHLDDDHNKYTEMGEFRLNYQRRQLKLKSGAVIIRVQCLCANNFTVYHDVHFVLPSHRKHHHSPSNHKHLSVMIIGIDSISHMHFLRTMPLLSAYIETLPHIEFWGYNRVGHNSYPNLIPLFSGLNVTELEAACYTGQKNYDKCDFIWRQFKRVGYETTYAEDNSVIGNFNYGKRGFNNSPTDFYLRPVMLEVDTHTRYSIDERLNVHCSGSRKYADILHEFMHKMMPHLKRGPHFSVFWETQGVHDYFNYPKFLDKGYLKLMKRLNSHHILSNTLVLLMADHGLRFGQFRSTKQGMLEESQPLLIAIYPKWLEEAYPAALANLRKNSHSLVTTFDLYATLRDLTNMTLLRDVHIENRTVALQKLGQSMPRGISLFLPIPETRNCQLASIPDQFCLCHKLPQISTTEERPQQAAGFMLNTINNLIQNYTQCHTLQLQQVQAAYMLQRSFNTQLFGVKVRFSTQPGEGVFEGTTTFSGNTLALSGPVLRINRYGNQPHCVHDYKIEMYCYCGN